MEQDQTEEKLRERIEALESENKRLRENKEQSGSTRRRVLAGMAGVAAAGAMGLTAATGSASAQSSVVFPEENDQPLEKIRANFINYQPLSGDDNPPFDVSSAATTYVLESDLP